MSSLSSSVLGFSRLTIRAALPRRHPPRPRSDLRLFRRPAGEAASRRLSPCRPGGRSPARSGSGAWISPACSPDVPSPGPRRARLPAEHREGQDHEADAREQERHAHDDAEDRELLRHVAHVERGRQRGLRDPDVPRAVRDRLAALVLQRGCLVARPRRVVRVRPPTGSGPSARTSGRPCSRACARASPARMRAPARPSSTCSPAHWLGVLGDRRVVRRPKVIPSSFSASRVVVYPLTPRKIATTPKTIRTATGDESADLPDPPALHCSTSRGRVSVSAARVPDTRPVSIGRKDAGGYGELPTCDDAVRRGSRPRDGGRGAGSPSGILRSSPTKEVAAMTEIASSWPRPARLVGG